MTKQKLLQLVEKLFDPKDLTEDEVDQLVETFTDSIPHPHGNGLIYYPQQWGLPANPSAEMIVDEALNWRPRIVAMVVMNARRHLSRDDLFCIEVELPGRIETQIVSKNKYRVGAVCAVALSGVRLARGKVVTHGFVDRVYTAGELLATTDKAPGTEFSASDFPAY
jgi:hypothetical protein